MRVIVRGLSKTFRSSRGQSVNAVEDLSLDVEDGELLVILGPSGSGKTTLLRCIAGLERADKGEITVDGRLVFSSEKRVWVPPERRGISMVFQSYALWPHMTTFDNVAYPLRARGLPPAAVRERVSRALALVECDSLERRHPGELSGGQQQRVAVARAIVGGSRVVLLDEPLSSVDARVREELRRELVKLQATLGFSAVYITHDQTEAMAIGHRVAVLAEGKIMQIAPPRDLYYRPESRAVAEFMGATNQFDGVVEGHDGARIIVRTAIGQVLASRASSDLARGAAVTLVIRPDHGQIHAAEPGEQSANSWRCKVERSLFLGYCTEYLLGVNDSIVTVRSSSPAVLEKGTTVWLTLPPQDIRVLSAT